MVLCFFYNKSISDTDLESKPRMHVHSKVALFPVSNISILNKVKHDSD